ncbi:MAG: fibronectin type III domain-containing protein, partial [Candidatus Aenigmarchaeota archaeon]|nr:fibronectin type III domain-containing protein [Candidatus Aenigmarchaeota archaeon]
ITINKPVNATISDDTFNVTFGEVVNWSAYELDSSGTNISMGAVSTFEITMGISDGQHHVILYANDSSGNMNSSSRYWTRDATPPDIYSVSNSSSAIRAYIYWETSEVANSSVSYGTSASMLNKTSSDSLFATARNLTLQYLTKNTTYYYNLTSCDATENCNMTGPYSFTTPVCIPDYTDCGAWSACSGGQKTRTCYDAKWCDYPRSYTTDTQSCETGGGTSGWIAQPPQSHIEFPSLNFTVLPYSINIELNKGEVKTESIYIRNNGEAAFNASIKKDGTASGLMTLSKDELKLDPGSIETITVRLFAGDDNIQGVYRGRIIVEGALQNESQTLKMQKYISVVMDVKEKRPLLDVIIEIKNSDKSVEKSGILISEIKTMNFGKEHADVLLKYVITDEKGKTWLEKTDTVAVDTQSSYTKSIQIPPGFEEGKYLLTVTATYGDLYASSSDTFWVTPKRIWIDLQSPVYLLLIIITILIVLVIILLYSRQHGKKKFVILKEPERKEKQKKTKKKKYKEAKKSRKEDIDASSFDELFKKLEKKE